VNLLRFIRKIFGVKGAPDRSKKDDLEMYIMNEKQEFTEAYLRNLSKTPRNEEGRKNLRRRLAKKFRETLPSSVERIWDLPNINIIDPAKPYGDLLIEAHDLYINGFFYSCVAMCGIVGERLIKDLLRTHVMIEKNGGIIPPDTDAFDKLERVEISNIVEFLKATELLSEDAAKAAKELISLRNAYAHARGKKPNDDALKAIRYLHKIVDDTVSIFKGIDLGCGVLKLKDIGIVEGGMKVKMSWHKPSKDHQ